MSQRVVLHVGTPKTGTSLLQDVLFRNRELLAGQHLHYPADRFDEHFLAALDLMSLPWGGLETEAVGAWGRLAERVRSDSGTSIISHEILARATAAQAQRALASLGHGAGAEIHIVLSVRDLVRQIPAEWQENVKHRNTITYARFLEAIRDPERTGRIAPWFWGVQEIPDILDRWGRDLPAGQVHLVTVPPRGAEPGMLWERFVTAFGLGGLDLDLDVDRANPSLGVAETALIRRINQIAHREVAPADYRPLVRELLAHQTLSRRRSSQRLGLPTAAHDWATALSAEWIAELSARGYDVIGDLDDLRGDVWPGQFVDPDAPADEDVVEAALEAIKALLLDDVAQRREIERLHGEVERALAEAGHAAKPVSLRARERVVAGLRRSPAGRRLLTGYRRLRGSSSRSA